ncbi:MAG: type II secretion system protein GspL [Deferrisomatales bacterium]
MPKTILGVQLGPEEALAVHLKGGWKGAAVNRVVRVALPAAETGDRAATLLQAGLPGADTVVAALPGDAAFHRLVTLPFSDRAKVRQVAPLEAEESLPLPLEEMVCHTHILERSPRGTEALVVASPEAQVAALVEELRGGGVPPDVVDIEALALVAVARKSVPGDEPCWVVDIGTRLCQVLALGPGGPRSFHALSAPARDPGLLEEAAFLFSAPTEEPERARAVYLSGPGAAAQDLEAWRAALGVPVQLLPFPREGLSVVDDGGVAWPAWAVPLGLALREGYAKGASQINLLQGAYAPAREAGPWKRQAALAGAYLAVVVAMWGAGVWSEASHRAAQYDALRNEVRQTFQKALPEVTQIVSEVDQMRARVEELENRAASLGSLVDREASPLSILREFSARISPDQEVEFRDFTIDEGKIRVEGVTTSFDAIDRIKTDLAQYPRFASVVVSDAKAGVERDKVIFKLAVNVGKER